MMIEAAFLAWFRHCVQEQTIRISGVIQQVYVQGERNLNLPEEKKGSRIAP